MKILALPRDDGTPYQELLYGEMSSLGFKVRYGGRLTPSHTLNLLLLPVQLIAGRFTGTRFVHIHWVFDFTFPGSGSLKPLRRLSQWWFIVCLGTIRILRLRLVWTAHNVLPHEPVFADDVAARRRLVAASDLVIAHSQMALDELIAMGAKPKTYVIIPHGPLRSASNAPSRLPGSDSGDRKLLFIGRILPYKGVEELLQAFSAAMVDSPMLLTVAGECRDGQLQLRLKELARGCGDRAKLRLAYVPESQVTDLLSAADIVVLPFRKATTSGSAALALSYGRPLVVPDLTAFADLPPSAVIRYDGSVTGLTEALGQAAHADATTLASMSRAARHYASQTTWHEIALHTASAMTMLLKSSRIDDTRSGTSGVS